MEKTRERIKQVEALQKQSEPTKINHVAPTSWQSQPYCPIHPQLNTNMVHTSTLAATYFSSHIPSWKPSMHHQQYNQHRAQLNLAYIPTRPAVITCLDNSHPLIRTSEEALPSPHPTFLSKNPTKITQIQLMIPYLQLY